jgi:purine nucleosidase
MLSKEKLPVIIDADTANEIDDLYAIVYAVKNPVLDIVGVCSTHFKVHDDAPADSVSESQKLNEELLHLLKRTDIPHPKGGNVWMGKAWGGTEPSDNDAVRFIIDTARKMPQGNKLILACQGAMTNAASALCIAPDIKPKISLYLMGFYYNAETKVWNKNEFNVRNDLNAADYLLNLEGLDLHIMTGTTSIAYKFTRADTFKRLDDLATPEAQYLKKRWIDFSHSANSTTWIMWDVALLQAISNPGLAKETKVITPAENTHREINVHTSIDLERMYDDFWNVLKTKDNHIGMPRPCTGAAVAG